MSARESLFQFLRRLFSSWNEPNVYVDGAEGIRIPKSPEASREVSAALRAMYPAKEAE